MFLNMDMKKALDKMEWCFLLAIMKKLGFDDTWIGWIESYVTSSSFSILTNGSPFGLFSLARGLRQGDPLSPFLFIFGFEVFSRVMFKKESLGHIKELKIVRNTNPIHHLLFVDDLLIFGKASHREASCIKSYLSKYCSWSGQPINALKSSARFNKNTSHSISTSIFNILPFNPNPLTSIYLGLPILLGYSKWVVFQSIIDKVQNKVEGWRSKTLSQASRLILIKSVAAAIPAYAMSSFLLPTSIYSKLDLIFKNFWWGFPS